MKLYEICLTPVILAGMLMATDWHITQTSKDKNEVDNAAVVQAMTCETGLGAGIKAASSGFYGLDLQYGITYQLGAISASFIPKLGVSAVDHAVKELPQGVQFGLGAQILLGYDRYRVGVELWHLSNGSALGLNVSDKPNIGLNLPLFTVGYAF